jgi:hypothetical protein
MIMNASYNVIDVQRQRISLTEFWDNGIIFIKIDDKVEIQLSDSMDQFEFLFSKYDGVNKHLVLVEPGKFTSLTSEAREYSQRPESNKITKATAVIVRSLAHRIVINFMISIIHQQTMKMKMFDDRKRAIEWLLSHKEQNP